MLLYLTGVTCISCECITKSSDLQCDPIIQRYGEKKQGLTSYTLTLKEQKENDYPIEGQFLSEGCSVVLLCWGLFLILTV